MNRLRLAIVLVSLSWLCPAQTGITVVGTGYSDPRALRIAPGQVTTLFVTGGSTIAPTAQRATMLPLPTTLAGFSATVAQTGGRKESLPIFSVVQTSNCASSLPDCVVTAITVQIPFDLVLNHGDDLLGHITTITISDGTAVSKSFTMILIAQNIHVLTACDSSLPNPLLPLFPVACSGIVTHADGTLVSAMAPAKIGEELVLYAFGLGATSPMVVAGATTPIPAPIAQVNLAFAYIGGTVAPAEVNPAPPSPNPIFAGLTPGQVGLYQVNFLVPAPANPTADCTGVSQTNLAITLTGNQSSIAGSLGQSTDTVWICVGTTLTAGATPSASASSVKTER